MHTSFQSFQQPSRVKVPVSVLHACEWNPKRVLLILLTQDQEGNPTEFLFCDPQTNGWNRTQEKTSLRVWVGMLGKKVVRREAECWNKGGS